MNDASHSKVPGDAHPVCATRILVICGEALVREGYRRIIERGLRSVVVHEADPVRGFAQALAEPWDAVLLEIPRGDVLHLEGLRRVRERRPTLPIVVLTPYGDPGQSLRVLRMNVHGFFTTECTGSDLVGAIRKVTSGCRAISPALASLALSSCNQGCDAPLHQSLSDREYEILCSLGSGCTLVQIARELHLSAKTITTYRARVLTKLHLRSTSQLVRYAVEHGLVGGLRAIDSVGTATA